MPMWLTAIVVLIAVIVVAVVMIVAALVIYGAARAVFDERSELPDARRIVRSHGNGTLRRSDGIRGRTWLLVLVSPFRPHINGKEH